MTGQLSTLRPATTPRKARPPEIFIQYWLYNYGMPCPTTAPGTVMTGTAGASMDSITLTTPTGAYGTAAPSLLKLSKYWTEAEFNIFGDGNDYQAVFASPTVLMVKTSVDATAAPVWGRSSSWRPWTPASRRRARGRAPRDLGAEPQRRARSERPPASHPPPGGPPRANGTSMSMSPTLGSSAMSAQLPRAGLPAPSRKGVGCRRSRTAHRSGRCRRPWLHAMTPSTKHLRTHGASPTGTPCSTMRRAHQRTRTR